MEVINKINEYIQVHYRNELNDDIWNSVRIFEEFLNRISADKRLSNIIEEYHRSINFIKFEEIDFIECNFNNFSIVCFNRRNDFNISRYEKSHIEITFYKGRKPISSDKFYSYNTVFDFMAENKNRFFEKRQLELDFEN